MRKVETRGLPHLPGAVKSRKKGFYPVHQWFPGPKEQGLSLRSARKWSMSRRWNDITLLLRRLQATPATLPPRHRRPGNFPASASEKTAALVKWLEESKGSRCRGPRCGGQEPVHGCGHRGHGVFAPPCQSLADGLMEQCTKNNYEFLRMEGYQTGQWILADLNDIVVHIFPAGRARAFPHRIPLEGISPHCMAKCPRCPPSPQNPPGTKTKPPAPRKCIMSLPRRCSSFLMATDWLPPVGQCRQPCADAQHRSAHLLPGATRIDASGRAVGLPAGYGQFGSGGTSISGPDASCIRI